MLLSAAVRDTARHLMLQEPQRLLLQGADDLTVASPPEATPPDPSDNGSEYLGPEDLSYWAVLFSLLLMVVNVAVSGWLRLGMELPLAVASARCIVQLVLVGYILRLIFPHYVLALLYTGIMLSVASLEAMSRPPHAYKGMLRHLIVAIGAPSYVVGAYTMVLCIGNGSWQQARYIIPLIGMLMGNCVTSVVLGQKTLMDEVKSGKDSIEWALAMGASRREALMPILQRCMSTAITPLLNQLALVGIVSLPGTMNGAILGGVDPEQAARYQVVIMFMLGSATTAAALLGVLGAAYHIVDDSHRLRLDRLTERHHSNFSRWGLAQGKKVVQKVASMWHRLRSSAQVGRAPWRMDSFLGLHWWQAVPENDEMMQQRGVLRDGIMSDTESLAGSIFSDGAPGTDPAGGSARHGRGVLDRESLPALGRTSASVRDSTIPEH